MITIVEQASFTIATCFYFFVVEQVEPGLFHNDNTVYLGLMRDVNSSKVKPSNPFLQTSKGQQERKKRKEEKNRRFLISPNEHLNTE